MTPENENPSHRDERSTAPYNADKVSTPEMRERLQKNHPDFKGDWSQLERFVRNIDDDVARSELKPEERLKEWNVWVMRAHQHREFIHLEGAALRGVHFGQARLIRAHLEGAHLVEAHLAAVNLREAHLEGADLFEAHLERARLRGAHLEGADLRGVHLEGADLTEAHLEAADLRGAHFEGANLLGAVLDQANLWSAKGMRFDESSVFRTKIEGNAKDPWSVLRRKYTGPWFFVHLLFLIAFFTPYIAKFLYVSVLSRAQDYVIEQTEALESQTEELERRLAEMAAKHEHAAPWLTSLVHALIEQRNRAAQTLVTEFNNRYTETRAVWVLIGWTDAWWAIVMAGIVAAYNVCRGILTLRVSSLRDAEERSQVTPRLDEYRPLYRVHAWANRLLYVAVGATALNVGYWAFATKVYTPRDVPLRAASQLAAPGTSNVDATLGGICVCVEFS